MSSKPWHRRPKETARAYNCFTFYYRLPPNDRSIPKAWRQMREADIRQSEEFATDPARYETEIEALQSQDCPAWVRHWSAKYDWVARALAHDEEEQARIDREWAERKERWRQQNWEQAEAIRQLVQEALPQSRQFIRSRTIEVGGEVVRIMAFDITALVNALERAAKLQGQALEVPSERVLHLFGEALDDTIDSHLRKLAGMADSGQASPPAPNHAKDS